MDVAGSGLQSRWMDPLVMDVTGGVDMEVTHDVRAIGLFPSTMIPSRS